MKILIIIIIITLVITLPAVGDGRMVRQDHKDVGLIPTSSIC